MDTREPNDAKGGRHVKLSFTFTGTRRFVAKSFVYSDLDYNSFALLSIHGHLASGAVFSCLCRLCKRTGSRAIGDLDEFEEAVRLTSFPGV